MSSEQSNNNMENSLTNQTKTTIVTICVVGFHHERGTEVEWQYPPEAAMSAEVISEVSVLAMPDQAHLHDRDYCYFRTGSLYAVACFLQINASKVKDQTDQIKRSTVQKSVVILSRKPLYGAIRSLLEPTARAYFGQGYFLDRQILCDTFSRMTSKFNRMSYDTRDCIYLGVSFKKFITRFGRNALLLYRSIWLEKRIIFYGVPVGLVCESVMALVSLLPYLLDSITSESDEEMLPEEDIKYGFPLGMFDKCYLAPYVALQHIDFLTQTDSFLVGSSNLLFINGVVSADLIVTLDGRLDWKNKDLEKTTALSSKDRQFIDYIIEEVAQNERQIQNTGAESSFNGSDTWIRNMFLLYTKCFLATEVNSDFGTGTTKNFSNYNEKFRHAWSTTYNYHKWRERVVSTSVIEDNLPPHPTSESKTVMQSLSSMMTHKLKKKNSPVQSNENLDNQVLRVTQSARNLLPSPDGEGEGRKSINRGNSLKNVSENSNTNTSNRTSKPLPQNQKKTLKNYFEHLRLDKSHESEDMSETLTTKSNPPLESKSTDPARPFTPTRSLNLRQWTISGDVPSDRTPKGESHHFHPKEREFESSTYTPHSKSSVISKRPHTSKLPPNTPYLLEQEAILELNTVMTTTITSGITPPSPTTNTDNNKNTLITPDKRPPPLRQRRKAFGDLTETLTPSYNQL